MYFVLKQEVWTEHTEKLIFLSNQQSLVHKKPMNHDLLLAIDNQCQVIQVDILILESILLVKNGKCP